MLAFAEELHTLLSAPYPFIHIRTYEETRALGLLRQLCGAMRRQIEVWRPEDHVQPDLSLDDLLESLMESTADVVTVLLDVHPYLNVPHRVRTLRQLQRHLGSTRGAVVCVGPVQMAPVELQKDWTVVDLPLPERDELEAILDICLPPETYPDIHRERVSTAALGLTAREAERSFERASHLAKLEGRRRRAFDWESLVVDEKRRLLRDATAIEFYGVSHGLGEVGGLDELKRWVQERSAAFSVEARTFGLPLPRGMLMVGVQGCGKSLAAKAVAGFWGIPLLRLDLGQVFSGSRPPDDALRSALTTAEMLSPAVLWLDEIDKGFDISAGGETQRLLGSLLTWLQEKRSAVFFVATANQVQHLPPELFRRGRFDEIFFVDLPTPEARSEILQIHIGARGREPAGYDIAELAAITDHFSGAELEQVVVSGLYRAFSERRELTQADLVIAARQLVPLYALYETEIKALRTWASGRARPAGQNRRLVELFTSS